MTLSGMSPVTPNAAEPLLKDLVELLGGVKSKKALDDALVALDEKRDEANAKITEANDACEALQEILDGDGLELSSLTNYPIQGLGVDQDLVRYALDEIQNAGYALDLVRANIKEVPDE